jgi:hypothetical protein
MSAHLFFSRYEITSKTPSTMIRPSFRRKQGFFRYSSVVEDRDASFNWKPPESPQSVKKTAELESLIQSLASEVVEHDKRLRQWLQVDDASMEGFKGLQLQFPSSVNPEMAKQEGNPKLHDSMSLRSFDCCSKSVGGEQPSDKDDLFPEEKLRMALASLSSSMESIESDRNALISKIRSMEKEQESQNKEDREQVVDPSQDITDVRQEMRVDVKDDGRALSTTCQSLQSEIAILKRQHKEEIMDRNIEDEEIVTTMRMMKEYIAQLEKGNSRTTEEYESQQATIAKADNFDGEVEKKTNDFKEIELTARVKNLEDENRKLNKSYSHQEQRKCLLEQENARLESQVEELQEEHQLLDDSVALMIEDESKWKGRIQDLEEEREMWLSSSQGKSLPNDDIQEEIRQDSGLEDEEMDSALNDVEARIEELEVELEHLKAKCASQECLIIELLAGDKEEEGDDEERDTKEEEQSKYIAPDVDVNEWKGKISGLQAEVDRSKALCHSQEEAFSKLVEQLEESLSTENENSNAEFKKYIHQSESKRELLETELLKLHAERDQLDSKCRSQECTMARLRSANGFMDPIMENEPYHETPFNDDKEESSAAEEESVGTFHEEMEKFNQNIATKGHKRESAIEMLEEQNELKDANLEILEDVVKSFIKERGEQSPRRVMAARLKEKLAFRRSKSPQENGDASSSGKPGVWC